MPLNLEESKYALAHILAVLMSPWRTGINYDNLKVAANRHQKRIDELEAAQQGVQRTGLCPVCVSEKSEGSVCQVCGVGE